MALLLMVLSAGMAWTAATATAAQHDYCVSCTENFLSPVADWDKYFLVGSYNHYLGTGTRLIGAGAVDVGSWAWGYNEIYHPYDGTHWTYAQAINNSDHATLTANAHASL